MLYLRNPCNPRLKVFARFLRRSYIPQPEDGAMSQISGRKNPSGRKFLGATGTAAAAMATGLGRVQVFGQALQPPQQLVLTNGRIHTMDARDTIVSTVSISNGRFVTVGNAAPARGPQTRVIDLRGRTVIPGIIEGHIHSVSLANR